MFAALMRHRVVKTSHRFRKFENTIVQALVQWYNVDLTNRTVSVLVLLFDLIMFFLQI